jgi:hypothetical protein
MNLRARFAFLRGAFTVWTGALASVGFGIGLAKEFRDEFLPADQQAKLVGRVLIALLPDIHLAWWIVISLSLAMLLGMEGAFRQYRKLRKNFDYFVPLKPIFFGGRTVRDNANTKFWFEAKAYRKLCDVSASLEIERHLQGVGAPIVSKETVGLAVSNTLQRGQDLNITLCEKRDDGLWYVNGTKWTISHHTYYKCSMVFSSGANDCHWFNFIIAGVNQNDPNLIGQHLFLFGTGWEKFSNTKPLSILDQDVPAPDRF